MQSAISKSVVIFSYARAELLRDCIQSVLLAKGNQDWRKVLIWQEGHADVYKVVEEYRSFFDLVVLTKPQHTTALGNINQNRIIGSTICFEAFGSDYVLGIEEDSMIGFDALVFIDEMVKKYGNYAAFRGVNLGSLERVSPTEIGDFSLVRFGLHGQGGVLTRRTWGKINLKRLLNNISAEGWDSRIEYVTKSGFMATPNASRLLDRGWVGTHAPTDSDHPYFSKMRESWVGTNQFEIPQFRFRNIRHTWRKDAILYSKKHSVAFLLRNTSIGHNLYKAWRHIHFPRLKFENDLDPK